MIRCSYTLLAASFCFSNRVEVKQTLAWKHSGCSTMNAAWFFCFFKKKDRLGFGANLASLAPIMMS